MRILQKWNYKIRKLFEIFNIFNIFNYDKRAESLFSLEF